MFHARLAAAVANPTLLAATSDVFTIAGVQAGEVPILLLTVVLDLSMTVAWITGAVGDSSYLDHLIRPPILVTSPQQATSRPRFWYYFVP